MKNWVWTGGGCDKQPMTCKKQKRGFTWILFLSCYLETDGGDILRHCFFIHRLCGWMNIILHDCGSVVHWLHSSSLLATRASIRPGPAPCWTLTSSSTGEQTEGLCIRCNNGGIVIMLGCVTLIHPYRLRIRRLDGRGACIQFSFFLCSKWQSDRSAWHFIQEPLCPLSSLLWDTMLVPHEFRSWEYHEDGLDGHLCIPMNVSHPYPQVLSSWASLIYWMNVCHPEIHCGHLLWPIHEEAVFIYLRTNGGVSDRWEYWA